MKTQNKAQLIGYLGEDPVIRKAASGVRFAKMRLVTDVLIPKLNEKPERIATWHEIAVWGEPWINFVENQLLKGSHLLVDGSICYRTYVDKGGKTRYVTEIKADHMMNLDR